MLLDVTTSRGVMRKCIAQPLTPQQHKNRLITFTDNTLQPLASSVQENWRGTCVNRLYWKSRFASGFASSHFRLRFMAERKYIHGLTLRQDAKAVVLDIGEMEIWDGADLSLIRDTLISMIRGEGSAVDRRSICST